jgi:hypothetical protein
MVRNKVKPSRVRMGGQNEVEAAQGVTVRRVMSRRMVVGGLHSLDNVVWAVAEEQWCGGGGWPKRGNTLLGHPDP